MSGLVDAAAPPAPEPADRSSFGTGVSTNATRHRAFSVSRQFQALAPGQLLPHAVCVFAEQVRREWAQLVETGPEWRDPVAVVVDPVPAPAPDTLRAARTELGLKYQIMYRTAPLDQRTLAAALVEAIATEYLNRARPLARGAPFTIVPCPPWAAQGSAQAVLGRDESLVEAARLSWAGGRPQTAIELLGARELPADPAQRRLFRANAWLLTEGLLGRPQGARKFRRYLLVVGMETDPSHAFWTVYGDDFRDAGGLERWWAVELADRLTTIVARNLTVTEAAARLDEILVTRVESVPTLPTERKQDARATVPAAIEFRDLARFDEQPWMADVLRAKLVALADLRARAVPVYRPVVGAYLEAVRWLAAEHRGRFQRLAAETETARARVEAEARRIRDHLDHAERVFASRELSETYDNFFAVFEEFDQLQQQRHSPISDYLDRFDR